MNKRMMNKRTLILTALIATIVAAFSLVGCGGNKQLSVSITNKDALTAAWVEGEADRTVEVKLSPTVTRLKTRTLSSSRAIPTLWTSTDSRSKRWAAARLPLP
ncbi:MAG: hypothetical protein ACLUSP_06985 [Christensenellales bacterium]